MSETARIRIVVGEDQPLVREGIVRVLEEAGLEVVGVAGDAEDLVRKAGAHHPDVVIADIQMPPDLTDDGLRAAQQIRSRQPDVGVVVLSQFLEDRYALDLVGERAQGVGYLLKDRVGDLALFIDAVRRVARGGTALDPEVVQRMVGAQTRGRAARRADSRRPGSARADGRGALEPGHRRRAGRDRGSGRAARHLDLQQARPPTGAGGPPARPRRPAVPSTLREMGHPRATELADWNVEAQPFLKSILDGVAQPVWVVDHEGFIRFANPAALAALGYDRLSELEGKPSHETIHYEYPDGSQFPVEQCPLLLPRKTGQAIHIDEDWFFRRDGTSFPVSYWSAPIEMPQGRGAVVAFTDIEERRQIERVLRERDAVLAGIEQPVYVGDDEGVIQYANSAAVRALGYDEPSELIGKQGHWLIHYKRPDGSHYPIEECPLTRVREIGEVLRVEEDWWVRKDGSMIQIAYSAVPIQTSNGFGTAIAFTDVTEPRRAEKALRSSEEHLREILKGAHEAFVSMDATGRIRAWNPEAEGTFGWTESEAIGRILADTFIPTRYPEETPARPRAFSRHGSRPLARQANRDRGVTPGWP